MNGLGIFVSVGRWGGLYFYKGFGFRLCLGFVAITLYTYDADDIVAAALALLEDKPSVFLPYLGKERL